MLCGQGHAGSWKSLTSCFFRRKSVTKKIFLGGLDGATDREIIRLNDLNVSFVVLSGRSRRL